MITCLLNPLTSTYDQFLQEDASCRLCITYDHVLAIMEDKINDESDKVEQKDKEGYENIKTTRSELESVYKELKITIAARDNEKPMKNLTITLDLLEKLQEEFEQMTEGGPGELFFILGINYLHSTIQRIVE